MKKRRVRRRLNVGKLLILLILSITIISGFFIGGTYAINYFNNDNQKEVETPPPVEEPKEEIYEISLAMVGDNLIHGSVFKDANKNAG